MIIGRFLRIVYIAPEQMPASLVRPDSALAAHGIDTPKPADAHDSGHGPRARTVFAAIPNGRLRLHMAAGQDDLA